MHLKHHVYQTKRTEHTSISVCSQGKSHGDGIQEGRADMAF